MSSQSQTLLTSDHRDEPRSALKMANLVVPSAMTALWTIEASRRTPTGTAGALSRLAGMTHGALTSHLAQATAGSPVQLSSPMGMAKRSSVSSTAYTSAAPPLWTTQAEEGAVQEHEPWQQV